MIFNLPGGQAAEPETQALAFFDGSLNTAVFGSMSGSYKVSGSRLTVNGSGNSAQPNIFTCSKYVDISAYSKLVLVVPENNGTKTAVRIIEESGSQKAAMTITAGNTGSFTLNLGSISGKCRLQLDASSNATTNKIVFSRIAFEK